MITSDELHNDICKHLQPVAKRLIPVMQELGNEFGVDKVLRQYEECFLNHAEFISEVLYILQRNEGWKEPDVSNAFIF